MENRCRLCAECFAFLIPILDDLDFCSKIFQLFQIRIAVEDTFPISVCQQCYNMVEKTWHFNDRIQKAQEILAGLIQNINVITSTESLTHQATVDSTVLPIKNDDIIMNPDIVELPYLDEKAIVENGFLPDDAEPLSDCSEKSVSETKVIKTKSKSRKIAKPKTPEEPIDVDYDINVDNSITPKTNIPGWNNYPWSCDSCQMVFFLSDELKEHFTNVHNAAARYICVDCPKVYSKYMTFIMHVKSHRNNLKFCCDVCFKWFSTATTQEQHRSVEHGEYGCPTCGKRFKMQSLLQSHIRTHLPAELKNRYQCDQCHKKFGTKPNLRAHKRIHTGIRDHTCKHCGKSFVQKGNLDNHLLTHSAVRPYTCNTCGKSFKTLIRLKKHNSVHLGLKPHQCEVCGRQFREKGTLKEHHRIHTGAMPYTCEFCGKCFRFKGVLTTHRRQHTGERPYSCNECQHHFTNWPNYNKHMKRRHGINTSVTCRTKQDIPPTGMPHRNPPGTVLAPPQATVVPDTFVDQPPTFFPVLNLYSLPEELLTQRI